MNTDLFFTKGSSHAVCEDYGLVQDGKNPYLIICDGCSSSENTDMGARLIAFQIQRSLKIDYQYGMVYNRPDQLVKLALVRAADQLHNFDIGIEALDCTVLVAYRLHKMIQVIMYGDGFFIWKLKSEEYPIIQELSFEENTPYYPSYELPENGGRKHNFIKSLGEPCIKINTLIGNRKLDTQYSKEYGFSPSVYCDDLEYLAVASDGLSSFIEKTNPNILVPSEEIVKQFTSFKNKKGKFVQRRVGKAIETLSKEGIIHYDDVSIAAMVN